MFDGAMKRGVLVATNAHQEWLLPWWWQRYESCNQLPVVFVDLGMTSKASAALWSINKKKATC